MLDLCAICRTQPAYAGPGPGRGLCEDCFARRCHELAEEMTAAATRGESPDALAVRYFEGMIELGAPVAEIFADMEE